MSSSQQSGKGPPLPLRMSIPAFFVLLVASGIAHWEWPLRWTISGAPFLMFTILLGSTHGRRTLPFLPIWTLFSTLNLFYAMASTSWLFYAVFTGLCYPLIFLTCLVQFDWAARIVRHGLRRFIKGFLFVDDTIALFDVPALKIDQDVDGLMTIRALTVCLSSLTIVAHGIEVGIKFSDDLELAIFAKRCTVSLFRGVDIGDCYANIKGGPTENKSHLESELEHIEETDTLRVGDGSDTEKRRGVFRTVSGLTDAESDELRSAKADLQSIPSGDNPAGEAYIRILADIQRSDPIEQTRRELMADIMKKAQDEDPEASRHSPKINRDRDIRAAICSRIHAVPTVPHVPRRSISVTTFQHLLPPRFRSFLHRMPLLLRLLLNPIAYFHPVKISSITAAATGRYIYPHIEANVFQGYENESSELQKLEKRIRAWLEDANFVVELVDIAGLASVPITTSYDILASLKIEDIIAHRFLDRQVDLEQVIRFGGGDAIFNIPSFLLPHHEHLLPPKASADEKERLKNLKEEAEDKLEETVRGTDLKQAELDESNVKISAHVRLPMTFSQDILNFIAALVKATKLVDMEKEIDERGDKKSNGIKDLTQSMSQGVRDTFKKTAVEAGISDAWVAKMVGKITKKMESARGDGGYSGDIPVRLDKYRLPPGHPEENKLLP